MKTKKKTGHKHQTRYELIRQKIYQKKFIVPLTIALIGSFFVWKSFAGTVGQPPICTTRTSVAKNDIQSMSACKTIGKTGGITYWLDTSNPGKRIHIVRIDLTNKHMYIRASQFDERGQTPSEFAHATKALAAING